VDGTSLLS
ncbi:unnamed protein product, partial [Allacma fusca]